MKLKMMICAVLFIVTPAWGESTGKEKSTPGSQASESKAVTDREVAGKVKVAAKSIENYAYSQKDEFVAAMSNELDKIGVEIDQLSTRVEETSGTVKADAKAKLKIAHEEWIEAKKRLDEAKGATESTWGDVQDGYRSFYDNLTSKIVDFRQWLSDKIAP